MDARAEPRAPGLCRVEPRVPRPCRPLRGRCRAVLPALHRTLPFSFSCQPRPGLGPARCRDREHRRCARKGAGPRGGSGLRAPSGGAPGWPPARGSREGRGRGNNLLWKRGILNFPLLDTRPWGPGEVTSPQSCPGKRTKVPASPRSWEPRYLAAITQGSVSYSQTLN